MHLVSLSIPLLCVCILLLTLVVAASAGAPADLPEAERALADTVDPWGLPFSDQLVRFASHFAARPAAPFAIGITHDLVKVWPIKYWYRGETVPAGGRTSRVAERWAAAGETQAFQVVVLPRRGAPATSYHIEVAAPGAQVEVTREVFVRTSPAAAYPRFAADRWPDPLLPEREVSVAGAECGVFWVDVTIPADASRHQIRCRVTVSDGTAAATTLVPINVVAGLDLDPKAFPFIAWFRRGKLTPEQYREQCALVLRHHAVPVDALKGLWDPQNPGPFDEMRAFLAAHGQRLFEVETPGHGKLDFDSLYAHLKARGWLAGTIAYSNQDEPDDATFLDKNIPWMEMVRRKYPGLKVYLASDWHHQMERGCDAWMTDLSASGYDPDRHRALKTPELWHYYCHLPIHWQMRAPLVQAPNMQIDNPALEHRLALWMSHYYGARTVFIWAGNAYTFGKDFWTTLTLDGKLSGYPYGGVHNGNGWIVYPSPDGAGTVASLRLKVIRDGLEDVALCEAARRQIAAGKLRGERARRLAALIEPVPGVFVHPQYFDQLPETLLGRREAILRLLAQ